MARARISLRSTDQPKEPLPTMSLKASQLGDGASKMKVNKEVMFQVTGKVIRDEIDTYMAGRPRRFQVEVVKVKML